ncbi:MAG: hypothetical protein OEV59_08070 [Deltaproteobacteria bacterium]|nr:hypothetical protein [Deltaproteobacteria bacterium]
MITQQKQLADELLENGWVIMEKTTVSTEWWLDEFWIIESTWSPVGLKLYVRFIVDPQHVRMRKKGEQVLIVSAGFEIGDSWRAKDCEPEIYLKPHWERNLPGFIAKLSKIRDGYREEKTL